MVGLFAELVTATRGQQVLEWQTMA